MTIDAGWVKILKTNVPRAFADTLPARADIVFRSEEHTSELQSR